MGARDTERLTLTTAAEQCKHIYLATSDLFANFRSVKAAESEEFFSRLQFRRSDQAGQDETTSIQPPHSGPFRTRRVPGPARSGQRLKRHPRPPDAQNGSEFTRRLMDLCAYHHHVKLDFSRPGKPTDNSFVETFNGSLRDECLSVHWFDSLAEAKTVLEAWRRDYNESRPHSALNGLAPDEYALNTGPAVSRAG